MAQEHPDILGDLADAKARWEVDGVQYVGQVEPSTLAPGQVTTLSLFLQSVLDVPIDFQSTLDLPRRPPGFTASELVSRLSLKPGEVGRLQIPIQVGANVPPGNYAFRLDLRGKPSGRGQRIRASQSKGRLPQTPIQDHVGLEIAPVVTLPYQSKMNARPVFNVAVAGAAQPAEADLSPVFEEIWSPADIDLQARALRELTDRRAYLVQPLTRHALFAAMMNESLQRFRECGVELHTGEAIFIAKILTHTVEIFLASEPLQDSLFVPIFKRQLSSQVPFDSAVWLLMKFGFEHTVNLAIALSFSMLETYRRARTWPLHEQRAARRFVVMQLTTRQPLPLDLVYAPLILGGVLAHGQLRLEGEDPAVSLQALAAAKSARLRQLTEEDDQIVSILDSLLPAGVV